MPIIYEVTLLVTGLGGAAAMGFIAGIAFTLKTQVDEKNETA